MQTRCNFFDIRVADTHDRRLSGSCLLDAFSGSRKQAAEERTLNTKEYRTEQHNAQGAYTRYTCSATAFLRPDSITLVV